MNRKLKNIITVSASALMLISVGANVASANVNVHASRISRLESRKAHYYREIHSINAQLAKLKHHTKRIHKHVMHHHSTKRIRHRQGKHHESQATYYRNNAKKWYRDYLDDYHESFKKGFNDASNDWDVGMNPDYINNSMYRKGWVIGYIYQDNDGLDDVTKGEVNNALLIYHKGVAFVNVNHPSSSINWDDATDGEWSN